jgi:ATP-dependent RNA helicase SUPV3L1/SUV3
MTAMMPRLAAVLGPTNTGKTFLAVERMLGHRTGMIGFPLRLLARENYDRVCRLAGPRVTALVTGEERIVPPEARYFLCTVEAMPARPVEFLAVDEIQLAADPERGHAFTDRLLNWRGREETMFVGAETIRPLVRRLLPGIETIERPRFSRLAYAGPKKLTRLPPRSAVVAFSVEDVYALAEQMRRRRGGAAVVTGALSPRTRNAQVGMFQAGEVDYLVATDAIGMGLNMDLDHVAFARLDKFDGRHMRRLTRAEFGQIAGRAGRHTRDGTFGTTGDMPAIDPETVEAIEEHRFETLRHLHWRNARLDERSLAGLLRSLAERPPVPELRRKRDADDQMALEALARLPDIQRLASTPDAVALLWQVAQVPDFRKMLDEAHTSLLARLYRHVMGPEGRLPDDWMAGQLARLDQTDGDLDALTQRIAHVRTWTYISHRAEWIADPAHWQERARAIEDKLSDALHDRLTERFVDRRAAALARRLEDGEALLGAVGADGRVTVEGECVGRLEGFRFAPDDSLAPAVLQAAHRALRGGLAHRVAAFERAPAETIALGADGRLTWEGAAVGRLQKGERALKPMVRVLGNELLDGPMIARVQRRLEAWLASHVAARLPKLWALASAELPAAARGIAFQLCEGLGLVERRHVSAFLKGEVAARLAGSGVRVGHVALYVDDGPEARALRALLASVAAGPVSDLVSVPHEPSVAASAATDDRLHRAAGYIVLGGRAVRADRLERLAREARVLSAQGAFQATHRLAQIIGASVEEVEPVLAALGYRKSATDASFLARPSVRGRRRGRRREGRADSPFAKLKDLKLGR